MNKNILLTIGLLSAAPVIANPEVIKRAEERAKEFMAKVEECHKYNENGQPRGERNPCLELGDMDASGLDLRNKNLQGAYLANCKLNDAILSGANLKNAYLWRANLDNAQLRSADLEGANLDSASLWRANLDNANLEHVHAEDAYFTDASLRDANLSRAHMKHANLKGSNLLGADLTKARLEYADLTDANLAETQLEGASLIGYLEDINFFGANFGSSTTLKHLGKEFSCMLPSGEKSKKCGRALKALLDELKRTNPPVEPGTQMRMLAISPDGKPVVVGPEEKPVSWSWNFPSSKDS